MSSPSSFFDFPNPAPTTPRVTTSRSEIAQIVIAYVVLTVDLLILFTGSSLLFGSGGSGLGSISPVIAVVAATAAFTGFVAHELAHKIVAERRGYWAEFRMWPAGLGLSLVTAFLGFLWGAPGATVVGGMGDLDRRGWGKTSVAGPLTNLAFAGTFYLGSIAAVLLGSGLVRWILLLAWINAWFGTFNLIPVGPLDGAKVVRWNAGYWAAAIVVTGTLAVVSWFALFVYGDPLLGG